VTRIAEILVRREYARMGKNLPDKFWLLPEYKKKYKMQCMLAAKFLRTFSQDIILAVLEQEKWCYSLAAKCLTEKFEIEKNKRKLHEHIKEQKESKQEVIVQENAVEFRSNKRKTFKDNE
jgi:hypothetical protein